MNAYIERDVYKRQGRASAPRAARPRRLLRFLGGLRCWNQHRNVSLHSLKRHPAQQRAPRPFQPDDRSCPGCHWNHRRTSMLQTKFLPIASGCSGICRRTVSPLYARARNPVRLRRAEQSMPGQSLPVFAWFLTGNHILFSPRGGVLYASKTHSFWLSSLPGPMAGGPGGTGTDPWYREKPVSLSHRASAVSYTHLESRYG